MTRARDLSRLANTNAISIDANNNIGIGSTIPDAKLDVVGIVSATSFYGDGANLTGIANTANIVSTAITTGVLKVGTAVTISAGVVTATEYDILGSTNTFNTSGVSVVGVVTATSFVGSGANLTNLNIPAGFNELDAALFN